MILGHSQLEDVTNLMVCLTQKEIDYLLSQHSIKLTAEKCGHSWPKEINLFLVAGADEASIVARLQNEYDLFQDESDQKTENGFDNKINPEMN